MVDRKGQCSTQVEPSSSSELQATAAEANDAPDQIQAQDPQQSDQNQVARPETPVILTGDSGGPETPVYFKLKGGLVRILVHLSLPVMMLCILRTKVNTPVNTGTQMIKMIK